jgi:hypothetical protein
LVVFNVMVGRKKGDNRFLLHFANSHQAIEDSGRGAFVVGLDQQIRGGHIGHLISIKTLVRSRQRNESLTLWKNVGHSAPGLLQQGLAADEGAELLGPIVTCNPPC